MKQLYLILMACTLSLSVNSQSILGGQEASEADTRPQHVPQEGDWECLEYSHSSELKLNLRQGIDFFSVVYSDDIREEYLDFLEKDKNAIKIEENYYYSLIHQFYIRLIPTEDNRLTVIFTRD